MQQSNLQQTGSTLIEKVDLNTITLRVMVPRIIILPYVWYCKPIHFNERLIFYDSHTAITFDILGLKVIQQFVLILRNSVINTEYPSIYYILYIIISWTGKIIVVRKDMDVNEKKIWI